MTRDAWMVAVELSTPPAWKSARELCAAAFGTTATMQRRRVLAALEIVKTRYGLLRSYSNWQRASGERWRYAIDSAGRRKLLADLPADVLAELMGG